MILTREVEIKLGNGNTKYYEDKGYEIPRKKDKWRQITVPRGTKIKVKVEDLSNNNSSKINVKCDNCNKIVYNIRWINYNKCQKDGIYFCRDCNMKLFGIKKTKQTKLKQSGCIAETHPDLVKYFVNKEDSYNYSFGSSERIPLHCPDCGHEKKIIISDLNHHGFSCPICSKDGYSYPEKLLTFILSNLNIKFETQKSFKWSNKKKYDFYIPSSNMIIETHGLQHYENIYRPLQKEQENDKFKEQLAKENGIEYYVILDCRKSELEWIKENIIKSELLNLLNFNKDDIDWIECHKSSLKNLIKTACQLWNNGIKSVKEISKELKISSSTITRYLKQGAELGWCNYDPKEEMRKKNILRRRPVICLTTNEIFASLKEAKEKYNIKSSLISSSGNKKSIGKHPITGEKLRWAYYNKDELKIS
jgi:DNA-binding MarR family transcriptional regulator/ribosomal protein S27E/very-short-patch-repair endonuclease